MNIKLRFQNKTTCTAIFLQAIAIIYVLLKMLGIVPPVEQEVLENLVLMVIELVSMLGIFIDPTTPGIEDSVRALRRDKPGTN